MKINFKQFMFLLDTFRQGQVKSLLKECNTWASTLRLLLNLGDLISVKQRARSFPIQMCNHNHDLKIDRDEPFEVLKMMVGGNVHEDRTVVTANHIVSELVRRRFETETFDHCLASLSNDKDGGKS